MTAEGVRAISKPTPSRQQAEAQAMMMIVTSDVAVVS